MALRDPAATQDLYSRHAPAMFALACRVARNAELAEEATQDAFVHAWRDAHRFDPERGSVLAWLLIITRGRTLDRLRARQLRDGRVNQDVDVDATMAPEISMERTLDDQAAMSALDEIMEVLPAADRRAIELAHFEGLTHTEIAQRLRVPLGTAKTQLRRGMQALRAAIDQRTSRPFQWKAGADEIPVQRLQLHDLNILIVDDEPDTLRLTALVLKRAGARVTTASSAREALTRLETTWPDVVLTDLAMPGEDGFALMTRLQVMRASRTRPLPAVAFTAHASDGDRLRTQSAGFDLHLAKPIRPAVLVRRVADLLRPRSPAVPSAS